MGEAYYYMRARFSSPEVAAEVEPRIKQWLEDWASQGIQDSPAEDSEYHIFCAGNEVRFCGTVWHCADWDPLASELKDHFGAIATGWISDEDPPDYFELIELE